jgi:hypothetical protein
MYSCKIGEGRLCSNIFALCLPAYPLALYNFVNCDQSAIACRTNIYTVLMFTASQRYTTETGLDLIEVDLCVTHARTHAHTHTHLRMRVR